MELIIICLLGIVIFFVVLYFVVNAAVRNAIIEARAVNGMNDKAGASAGNNGNDIAKVICPDCGKEYDMDYPKCPYCK